MPALPAGQKKVVPGQAWTGVPLLVARLQAVGDLVADVHETHTHYTGGIVDAVKRFQTRHGLEADGVIGASTLRAINVPLAARVRQIELAMERMRWLPLLDDEPNILVNVANFRLWANAPHTKEEPLRMNVVVGGALDHQTPLFVEQLEYVVFRPFWNPPRSILLKEILPRARKDPAYMARNQYEIVASGADDAPALAVTPENLDLVQHGRLALRQRPGPEQLARARQVHLPERRERVHARHAVARWVREGAARSESRLRAPRGPGRARDLGAAGPTRVDPRAHRRRHDRRQARARRPPASR